MAAPASSSSSSLNSEYPTCSICTSDVVPNAALEEEQSIETRCGHVFHQFCLNRWMSFDIAQGKCPNCRQIAFPLRAPAGLPQNPVPIPPFEPAVENFGIPENVAMNIAGFLALDQPLRHQYPIAVGGMGPPPDRFKELISPNLVHLEKSNDSLIVEKKLKDLIANEFFNRIRDQISQNCKKIEFPQSYQIDRIQPIVFNVNRILEGEREQRAIMLQRIIAASFEPQPVQLQPQSLWARMLSYLPWFNRQ